jgi:excinuclease UvrABC nuclease subunit
MNPTAPLIPCFSPPVRFKNADWSQVAESPGVYVIFDVDEVIYVGMAGRDGGGNLRKRLKDHSTGQLVNMFSLYLFLARVQFQSTERFSHPSKAKKACQEYIADRCSFCFHVARTPAEARALEETLKRDLAPALNGVSKTGST